MYIYIYISLPPPRSMSVSFSVCHKVYVSVYHRADHFTTAHHSMYVSFSRIVYHTNFLPLPYMKRHSIFWTTGPASSMI